MLRVDLGDGVEHVARSQRVAALWQRMTLDRQPLFDVCGKQRAWLQEQQLVIEITEGVFGLQMQVDPGAHAVPLKGGFDPGQQVLSAEQKFDRLVQLVKGFAQGVLEGPGQGNHALFCNVHGTIVAPWIPNCP